MDAMKEKYLERLSELYPSIAATSTEIINLQAVMNLPKGTENFLTDIHGEYEAFAHVLKNGSGSVKRKINDIFGNTMTTRDKQELATLIYYPREKIHYEKKNNPNLEDWYKVMLYRLIEISKRSSNKYSRSKVRKSLPKDFAYVIDELITERNEIADKEHYYNAIVKTIIEIGRAEQFIIALSELIQRLVVDHLHIVGDIFDRGPAPHLIMDKLMEYHSVDIQWGNHDILWMGAAAGQKCCIANVIRICARYGNLDILEDAYGINLLPLANFAMNTYRNDPCTCFALKGNSTDYNMEQERELNMKMHKAISVMQFKIEGKMSRRRPEFEFESRNLLHMIDFERGTVNIDGESYPMKDMNFPTIDPLDPYRLSEEENEILHRLASAFRKCEKLQKHMRFLLNKGSMYKVYNGNLLYHGCVPLNEDGTMMEGNVFGRVCKGKEYFDALDAYVRKGFFSMDPEEKEKGKDLMWFIWQSPKSPLFGKAKMATFERYFLEDPKVHKEVKNCYYQFYENEEVINGILHEFGLDSPDSVIINGHVPVKTKNGEDPVKCHGKVLIIDGGFSKAYQKETGIAGYTLIYNSYGLILAAHEAFESAEAAIENGIDIYSENRIVTTARKRLTVGDTDRGKQMKERIEDLKELLEAYRSGMISEK